MQTSDSDTNHLLQAQKWCAHEFLYKFNDFWFTKTYLQTTQKVVESFNPVPKDVILASFPKTGTTWLKALLHSIIHRSSQDDHINSLLSNHPQELVPSLETNLYVKERTDYHLDGTVKDCKNGRILATHIPYQILGDVLNSIDNCKIVYVTRNPKDTLVSLWHFLQRSESFEDDPWELEVAVDHFCKGFVPFGSYYDHVLAYREESIKRPEKVLLLTYEDLKENPRKHVRKLGEFLGCSFEEGENGDEEVEKIVKICSFEVLSNQDVNKSSELPISGFPLPYNSFFRKGEVGDHKNFLQDFMIQKIDDVTRDKFYASGFEYGI